MQGFGCRCQIRRGFQGLGFRLYLVGWQNREALSPKPFFLGRHVARELAEKGLVKQTGLGSRA